MISLANIFSSNKEGVVIYCIKNSVTNCVYIGQTATVEKRWKMHRQLLRKGTHNNIHLQADWNNYGEEKFIFTVLEHVKKEYSNKCEQSWIEAYAKEACYNKMHNFKNNKQTVENLKKEGKLKDIEMKKKVKKALLDYGKYRGVDNPDMVMDYVQSQLGVRPAKDTVADVLREMGYTPIASQWVK